MQLIVDKSTNSFETIYTLKISESDIQKAKIKELDYLLFDNCNKKDTNVSDILLALETLAKRIEEGNIN